MMKTDKTQVLYGDRFITTEDIKTVGAVIWAAPYTGGFECVLPKGTVLVTRRDQVVGASAFNCVPEKYEEFEKKFVPASDRFTLKYSGYYFTFSNEEIGSGLQHISCATARERQWYDFKEKIHQEIGNNIFLHVTVFTLCTIFIIATLPLKPFIDMYRRGILAAKRKAEEAGM